MPHSLCPKVKLQVPPLRYPGFPVEVGGVGELRAAFFTESRIRGLGGVVMQEIRVRVGSTASRGRRDDKVGGWRCTLAVVEMDGKSQHRDAVVKAERIRYAG